MGSLNRIEKKGIEGIQKYASRRDERHGRKET
jgi:hypothetical protein